jgi:hypothetical protein
MRSLDEANALIDEACVATAEGAQEIAAEMDRLRAEVAQLREELAAAVPPAEVVDHVKRSCRYYAIIDHRTVAWLSRLDAYHAAHARKVAP